MRLLRCARNDNSGISEISVKKTANSAVSIENSITDIAGKKFHFIGAGGVGMSGLAKLPQTPRAKKVIEHAIEEARTLNHNYVGTEHILLGLLRETGGIAAQVLTNLGLKLDNVRLLAQSGPSMVKHITTASQGNEKAL